MSVTVTKEELLARVGKELGTSEWLAIDQARIDRFADVTEDHQFIHVDRERAAATPLGGTIAHGLLTLAMIVRLTSGLVPQLAGTRMLLNYGFDKVRFLSPVRSGARIRARVLLAAVEERKAGQMLVRLDTTIEIEHEEKPALFAEWLSLHVVS
jgi:acyl dehydratase